jgi:hypothetical protein
VILFCKEKEVIMLDLTKYAIGADVWSGSGDINEDVFMANGVEFIGIRMNISNGSLILDSNFITQWAQASRLKRFAYWVVAPLYWPAAAQANFILAHLPADCKLVCLDVEIHWTETPAQYHALLDEIILLLKAAGLRVIIYSGLWVAGIVGAWPWEVEYWWARYPDAVHPVEIIDGKKTAVIQTITWEALKAKLSGLIWEPLVPGYTSPGKIDIWQVTSSYVLPGCPPGDPVDINLMSRADFERIFGAPVVIIPPVTLTLEGLDTRLKVVEAKVGV